MGGGKLSNYSVDRTEDGLPRPSARKQSWNWLTVATAISISCLYWLVKSFLCHDLWCTRSTCGNASRSEQSPVIWTPCGDNIFCGRLEVPLDYHNASAGTASLALAKYAATVKAEDSRLGTLFVNPGGPGGSGVSFIYRTGQQVSKLSGGRYDIVGWDPRGINGTTPRVECFGSQTDQDLYHVNIRSPDGRNLSDPVYRDVYAADVAYLDALDSVNAQLCHERSGDILNYVGTATVVRDLERLSSVLEGPETPVNFWGFSYGTAVGSYFVNMFPERVGRVIIDGNVDADKWANVPSSDWEKYDFVDAEKALQNFVTACSEAGAESCDLAKHGSTPKALMARIDDLLELLYDGPLPVPHARRPGVLTAAIVRAWMFVAMYKPRDWRTLASHLSSAINGDGAPILNLVQSQVELNRTVHPTTESAIFAVTCIDVPPFPKDIDRAAILKHNVDEAVLTAEIAPHFAGLGTDGCHNWKGAAKERFTGPWNHTLSNTILIIGNTADPITPLINARINAKRLGKSARLITQNSSGHCSIATASLCTAKAVQAYFLNNTLPEEGIFCESDEVLFSKNSQLWAHSFKSANAELNAEDISLLESVKALGESFAEQPPFKRGLRMQV